MVNDENVFFLRDGGDLNNLNISFIVFFFLKNEFENLSEIVLFLDLVNFLEVFKVDSHFFNVCFLFLPQDVGLLGFADHYSDQKNLVSGENALDFSGSSEFDN